ncbi:MAG: bifunctional hydroxymethylpyrimidine kinase/phosphomethylpyrimidine kinase [Verrucomicrobiales bacterium]
MNDIPIALTIAGADSSGGAGIQADLKTFQHFGVYGMTAITCVVAESSAEVRSIHPIPTDIVHDQISLLLESYPIAAIKTGMLYSEAIANTVASILEHYPDLPLIVDPVMIASTGDSLAEGNPNQAYLNGIFPHTDLITPNLDEAETLLGAPITSEADQAAAAFALHQQLGCSILLKGGHLEGPQCLDLLVHEGERTDFRSPRIHTPASHGTGCTLAAAIAAGMACGHPMTTAIDKAKTFLNQSLRHAFSLGKLHALNQGTSFSQAF